MGHKYLPVKQVNTKYVTLDISANWLKYASFNIVCQLYVGNIRMEEVCRTKFRRYTIHKMNMNNAY